VASSEACKTLTALPGHSKESYTDCMLLRRAAHVAHTTLGPRRSVGILSAAMGLVHGKDAANRHEGAFTELTSADILDKPVGFQAFAGKVCVVTNVASE